MSSSVLIHFTLQGDEDDVETGIESSFRVEVPATPRRLTYSKLEEAFPFSGTFHFRLKVADDAGLAEYCWIDLSSEVDDVFELARNLGGLAGTNGREPQLHLKVLPLDFGTQPENEEARDEGVTEEAFGRREDLPADPGLRVQGPEWSTDELAGGVAGIDLDVGGVERGDVDRRRTTWQDDGGDDNKDRFDVARGGGVRVAGPEDAEPHPRAEGKDADVQDAYGGYDVSSPQESYESAHWRSSVENTLHSGLTQASQGVKDLQKKSAQVAKTMGFGAKKLWQTINKGVGGPQLPSPEALENLHELTALMNAPFSIKSPEHLSDLEAVWACVFPGQKFEGTESVRWKAAGFRETKVAGDFVRTGVLALKSIAYFCKNYDQKALALCKAQSGGRASKYPWAIVGNNITLMLADVLELKGNVFASSRRGYWGVFERRAAYFEVFCMAFTILDEAWNSMRATRDQFGKIIGHTRNCIQGVLETNPTDLQAFMDQAKEMGMVR